MKLSTKGRYAVMALCDLATHAEGRPVALADIAERQEISLSYLEQLFAKMRRNNLVVSTRGPGGGYSLGTTPDRVCIADVINAVDDALQVGGPVVDTDSSDYEPCLTEQLWEELSAEIERYLTTISLADMMENDEVKALSRAHDLRQQPQNIL